MAFDLVQYFSEQIKIQKPELLNKFPHEERNQYLAEANTLALGKLITLIRKDGAKLYHEIQTQDHLYIQELARHLTTSPHNVSQLAKADLEHSLTEMLSLQFAELKQLDDVAYVRFSSVYRTFKDVQEFVETLEDAELMDFVDSSQAQLPLTAFNPNTKVTL